MEGKEKLDLLLSQAEDLKQTFKPTIVKGLLYCKDREKISKWLSDVIIFIETETILKKDNIIYEYLKNSYNNIGNLELKKFIQIVSSLQSIKDNYEDIKISDGIF